MKRNLERYGFTLEKWNVARQAEMKAADGEMYFTSDGIDALPDRAFEPLYRDQLEAEIEAGADPIKAEARLLKETRGGMTPFGLGGEGLSSGDGIAGSGYGSGGSGASTGTSGTGADGICIIEEFS